MGRASKNGSLWESQAEFRYQIRKFLRFSERTARAHGIQPQHYQLMLAVRGIPQAMLPTIGALAERMQLEHHSTVELVDRATTKGLVERVQDDRDRRLAVVHLTTKGERGLNELASIHREELGKAGSSL